MQIQPRMWQGLVKGQGAKALLVRTLEQRLPGEFHDYYEHSCPRGW